MIAPNDHLRLTGSLPVVFSNTTCAPALLHQPQFLNHAPADVDHITKPELTIDTKTIHYQREYCSTEFVPYFPVIIMNDYFSCFIFFS